MDVLTCSSLAFFLDSLEIWFQASSFEFECSCQSAAFRASILLLDLLYLGNAVSVEPIFRPGEIENTSHFDWQRHKKHAHFLETS